MFTAETLLRWLEDLAVQHGKTRLGEDAWKYAQALVGEEYNAAYELLAITDYPYNYYLGNSMS